MSATGTCPGCGAQIVFRVDTTTTAVCAYCRSVVIRGGTQLELVGKTNNVFVTGTVLMLGLEGRHQGRAFTVVGRTQLAHTLGGMWDEWLLALPNGRLAWLAEHQGRFALMGEQNVHDAPRMASPTDAVPGRAYLSAVGELIVAERGEATIAAEEGDLPGRTLPGSRRPFVDFSSHDGRVATLDFGAIAIDGSREPKRFFVGREVALKDIGLERAEVQEPVLPRQEGSTALRCPHCGAPVEKKLTETQTLVCGSCGSALSVDPQNKLGILFAQERLQFTPTVPVGKKATLDQGFFRRARVLGEKKRPWPERLEVEVIGHMVRSVVIDGVRYHFQEHLLHAAKEGYFWLVESDGKWLFVRNLEVGRVAESGGKAVLEGSTFTFEQRVTARVEQVLGELSWRVNKGDTAQLTDYRHAPRTLSKEKTTNELIWTECLDVDRRDVERVFSVQTPEPEEPSWGQLFDGQPSSNAAQAIVVLLVFFFVFVPVCGELAEEDSGYGGGHGTSSGGGGFSFGK